MEWCTFQVNLLTQIAIQFLLLVIQRFPNSVPVSCHGCSIQIPHFHSFWSFLHSILSSGFRTSRTDYQTVLGSLYLDLHVVSFMDPGHCSFPKSSSLTKYKSHSLSTDHFDQILASPIKRFGFLK